MPDVSHMFGASVGDSSGWGAGVAQASVPVSNLSPHVDGGTNSAQQGTNEAAPADSVRTLHVAVGMVLLALILLWLFGAVGFRGHVL